MLHIHVLALQGKSLFTLVNNRHYCTIYRCAPGSFSHLATTNYTQRAWLACVDSLVPGARGWLLAGMQASYTPAMSDGCLYYTTCVASLARSTSGVPLIPQVQQFKK